MRIALIILLALAGCQEKKKEAPERTFPVKVSLAEAQDTPIFLEGLGHVESITTIQIRSRIEGELTGVYFNQGQEVRKGDLLFTIDPKPYEANLKAMKGALEQSLADLAIAEEKVKRYKTLAKDEYYSQIDYETLQANYAANLGIVEKNKGEVDRAKIQLDYCWIYAPIDGLTGILQIDYGNLVQADGMKPLVTLNQIDPIFVTFSIPEIHLPKVQKAMKESDGPLVVEASYEDFLKDKFEGCLYMVDNRVDENTGMIKLRGLFQNGPRSLWPGQFIRTRLVLRIEKKAVIIPFSAVVLTMSGPTTFVLKEDNTVELRSIKLGQRQDALIIVTDGLKAGEQVITDGQLNLFDGAKAQVRG